MVERPLAIDCFAGAGGLARGLVEAGIDICFAFDSNAEAMRTYRHNLGDHAHQMMADEVTPLLISKLLAGRQCHLVVGGPPCQGFSVQRRGAQNDVRNDLIFEFLRIIADVRPTMFLMENVAALQGPRGQPYLQRFKSLAAQEGYLVHVAVLNAVDFGVAQSRRRLFIVGEIDDGKPSFVFPTPLSPSKRLSVRDAIGDLPSPTVHSGIPNHEPDNISPLNRERIAHVPPGGGREHIPEELRLPCHRVAVSVAGHRNVYGRLHWDEPAGTITTKCNSFTRGKFAHPSENRNISMREAARLQGFSDDFAFLGDKVSVAHQIGNAVPPPLAKHLGEALVRALAVKFEGLQQSGMGQPSSPSEEDNVRAATDMENQSPS